MTNRRETGSRAGYALVSALGAATGAAAVILFSSFSRTPVAPSSNSPAVVSKETASALREVASWNEGRVARLEATVGHLKHAAVITPPNRSIAPTPEPLHKRETQEDLTRTHENRIVEHFNQAHDPRWSETAETGFRSDLGKLGETGKFAVSRVDCRTTTCIATLSWPSRTDAMQAMPGIVHAAYRSNCGKTLHLPDEIEGAPAYEATVVFDCASERATSQSAPPPGSEPDRGTR